MAGVAGGRSAVLRGKAVEWVAAVVVVALALLGSAAAVKRPHIVFILADDLGYNDVSFHGSSQVPTPNIDALAASGSQLNNYYVQPVCSPTRTSLLSGRHVIHTGVYVPFLIGTYDGLNTTCNLSPSLNPSQKTCKLLPEVLNGLGYDSHMVGKWHLGFYEQAMMPTSRGFKSSYGYLVGEEDYFTHIRANGYDMHDGFVSDFTAAGNYSTELFTDKAIRIIEEHANTHVQTVHDDGDIKPLFLYLAFQNIHAPVQAPLKYIDPFNKTIEDETRRTVAGMINALDIGVGRVVDALRANGMLEDTTIVFSTDNGGPAHLGGNMASNIPLKGRKTEYWEGGIRGVGLIAGAGITAAPGFINNESVHVCDFYPSLAQHAARGIGPGALSHAEAEAVLNEAMGDQPSFALGDGVALWDTLASGAPSPRNETIHVSHTPSKGEETSGPSGVLRAGRYKLVSNIGNAWSTGLWYSTPGQNYSEPGLSLPCGAPPSKEPANACKPKQEPCLFDIESDPCEHHNVAGTHQAIVQQLMDRLRVYVAQSQVPRNSGAKLPPSCMPSSSNNFTWGVCPIPPPN